jgi:hypothetical protein
LGIAVNAVLHVFCQEMTPFRAQDGDFYVLHCKNLVLHRTN